MKVLTEDLKIVSGNYRLNAKRWFVKEGMPTIVFLHGLGFHLFEYEDLAPVLAENGYNCLAFDFRCHGRSEGKTGYWTLQGLVDDTKSAIDYVCNRFDDRVGVFGNSLGAIVGIYAASQDRRIKSIFASGCPSRPSDFLFSKPRKILLSILNFLTRIGSFRISVNFFIPYSLILSDRRWIYRIKNDQLVKEARKFAVSTYNDTTKWDATKVVGRINAPILVLHGKRDRLQPLTQSEILYEAANEPKEFKLIDTEHLPDIENIELLSKIIIEWFNKNLK